jgi:hypothetical protein
VSRLLIERPGYARAGALDDADVLERMCERDGPGDPAAGDTLRAYFQYLSTRMVKLIPFRRTGPVT